MSRFFSAGFYYKTFIRPRFAWKHIFEPIIRRSAGLGNAPSNKDVEKYEHVHFDTDILIVGAGIAGIMAAKSFQDTGLSVLLCEKDSEFGGRLVTDAAESEREIHNKMLKKNIGKTGVSVSKSFEYSSNSNDNWLSVNNIKQLLK